MNYNQLNTQEYNKLVGYAIGILTNKKYTHIDGKDIVHNAFLSLYNANLDYSFDNMKPLLYKEIFNFTHQLCDTNTAGMVQKKDSIFAGIEMKTCKHCTTLLPVSFFYVSRKYPDGLITYASDCKECHNARTTEKKKQRLTDPLYYQAHLEKQNSRYHVKAAIIASNPKLQNHFRKVEREKQRGYKLQKCA